MNIPSTESLYATIEQQQRVIKQAHEDIAKLTAERDAAITNLRVEQIAHLSLTDLLENENDALKSALHEARSVLLAWAANHESQVTEEAIATITAALE